MENDTGYKRLAAAIVFQATADALKGDAAAREWLLEDAPSLMDLAGIQEVNTGRIDEILDSGMTWRQVRAGKVWAQSSNSEGDKNDE